MNILDIFSPCWSLKVDKAQKFKCTTAASAYKLASYFVNEITNFNCWYILLIK